MQNARSENVFFPNTRFTFTDSKPTPCPLCFARPVHMRLLVCFQHPLELAFKKKRAFVKRNVEQRQQALVGAIAAHIKRQHDAQMGLATSEWPREIAPAFDLARASPPALIDVGTAQASIERRAQETEKKQYINYTGECKPRGSEKTQGTFNPRVRDTNDRMVTCGAAFLGCRDDIAHAHLLHSHSFLTCTSFASNPQEVLDHLLRLPLAKVRTLPARSWLP